MTKSPQHPFILRCDVAGRPQRWIQAGEAVVLYSRDLVSWECGLNTVTLMGGWNRATGLRTSVTVNAIIAVKGEHGDGPLYRPNPPLTNATLWRRDGQICMYCGSPGSLHNPLTRDHVVPRAQGGKNNWNNCVCACRRCNQKKSDLTPWEAGMELLAVPYAPTYAEYLALTGRRILADQMAFLQQQFPKNSPLMRRQWAVRGADGPEKEP